MSRVHRQRAALDDLYARFNQRAYVYPDPLETLYPYEAVRDREIVGLIAAMLAFGGVGLILRSIARVLEPMENRPRDFLDTVTRARLRRMYKGFRYRWVDGDDLAAFLWAIRETVRLYGSLENAFTPLHETHEEPAMNRLTGLITRLRKCGGCGPNPLMSDPDAGSACKRLHLFLRWMIRKDRVDPGGWTVLTPAQCIVPVDRHMHRIALDMRLTRRKQADLKTALEVTAGFRRIRPDDPVRYDFALTRFGIRKEGAREAFVTRYRK